ncbi:gp64 [Burkholderia phage Bcep43]|uniref:Gp64 n=1 Tax=Burkholderia phage Bcep43 TaxID=2883945 RepID=Q6UK87_9CAUD|nr:tail protein [Burkholderia phage Bcep43]AAR89355.1 gp64 [Burkholderia phage Bcep43]
MKFEFNSIGELQEFLEFAGYEKRTRDLLALEMLPLSGDDRARLLDAFGAPPQRAPMTTEDLERAIAGEIPVPDAQLTPEERAQALLAVHKWAEGEVRANAAPQAEPEPPKRKRRTKAEIEADKAAAAASAPVVETPAPSDAQATAATSPLAGANPFDASTSNAPAATAALNEAPAGATSTLNALANAQVETAVLGDGAKSVDPQAFIQLRVAEMGGTFDPREHMKKCVEFIGALGKAKYDEAFTLAGTSRAVASYTPADCAKHIAALEYLQIAG